LLKAERDVRIAPGRSGRCFGGGKNLFTKGLFLLIYLCKVTKQAKHRSKGIIWYYLRRFVTLPPPKQPEAQRLDPNSANLPCVHA
jgi:hypothetical protein